MMQEWAIRKRPVYTCAPFVERIGKGTALLWSEMMLQTGPFRLRSPLC